MKKSLLYMVAIAAFLISCGDDDSPIMQEVEKISIEDGNAVTQAIKISGSTTVSGNPPAPSTDANAPKIKEGFDPTAISGSNIIISVSEETEAEVAGVYLKVKGADSYFDIPASALGNTNGRIKFGRKGKYAKQNKTASDLAINIELPNNLEPGIFCVEYCIYDAENRVSNIVEVCIEVLAFGGENSDFLTANEWSMISNYFKEIYSGQTYEEEEIIGEDQVYEYNTQLHCNDGSTIEAPVREIDRTDYVYASFNVDGAFATESSYYEKNMDYENSNCQTGVLYIEKSDEYNTVGAWSYDDTNKKLTLLFEDEWENNGVTYSETYVEVYDVELSNDQLKLSYEEEEENYYDYTEIVFEVK